MFRTPRNLPSLADMLDDIKTDRRTIAKHLGITSRTLARYEEKQHAPRPIMLALFWETQWGRETADAEAQTWSQINALRAELADEENAILRTQLLSAERLIPTNAPFFLLGKRPEKSRAVQRSTYSASKRFRAAAYAFAHATVASR